MYSLTDLFGIVLAVILGSAIGFERELSGKPAGLRTNTLICLGAAAFTQISLKMGLSLDPSSSRIAAQIVTGVGFLGAGAIIQDRGGIHGLTTAASIWLVAAIGMACGSSYFILAVITTAISLAVLFGFSKVDKMLHLKNKQRRFLKQQNPDNQQDNNL